MDSNHRSSPCKGAAFAARPQDHFCEWTHRESHPDLRLATPVSSCWTMSPICERRFAQKQAPKDLNPDQLGWSQSCCHYTRGVCFSAEAVRLELTTVLPAPVFKTGSSSGRMASITSCGGRNRTRVTTVQSRLPVPAQTLPHQLSLSCGGRSRTCGHVVQSHVFLPTETTPHC